MGGKRDKRKKDPKKKEEKKKKQDQKAAKKAGKASGKDGGGKELQEEDIEAILAEIRAKDAAKTAVTITDCPQPSPRANFSLTTLPSGEMLMFGGEYYDGEDTTVYNGVFRWNLERGEWRQVESINTPPPRCSHQAVCYRDHLYVFGGEFGTSDQFYHYRDFWRLDLKTNKWEELPLQKDTPSARSGHRMAVWRNYLVLFGGFYEAFRETKWFNDLFLFNFQDQKWKKVDLPATAQVPAARSGCQLAVSLSNDVIFIHGGYSKVKQAAAASSSSSSKASAPLKTSSSGSGKAEGYVHEDTWALQLKNVPNGGQPFWERVSRKGSPPSARSGASMVGYKTIALSFGGVHDVEGKQHAMASIFYADLFQFDMTRRRWYAVGLRHKTEGGGGKRRKAKKGKGGGGGGAGGGAAQAGDEDEDDEEEEEGGGGPGDDEDEGFAYIDAEGNVVYLKDDEDEDEEGEGGGDGKAQAKQEDSEEAAAAASRRPAKKEEDDEEEEDEGADRRNASKSAPSPVPAAATPAPPTQHVVKEVKVVEGLGLALVEHIHRTPLIGGGAAESKAAQADGAVTVRVGPLPRINAALTMRGHLLYLYGGVYEDGDREYCLDDAWCLDLNRREEWRCLLPGTMHLQVWKGDDDETTEGGDYDSSRDDEEEESDDDGASSSSSSSSSDSESGSDESESESEDEGRKKKKKKKEKEKEKGKKKRAKKGLKEEIAELQASLAIDDADRTPQLGEKLRDFFARTTEYWTRLAVEEVDRRAAAAAAQPPEETAPQELTGATAGLSLNDEEEEAAGSSGSEDEAQTQQQKQQQLGHGRGLSLSRSGASASSASGSRSRGGAGGSKAGGGGGGKGAEYVMREKEYRRLAFEMATQRFEELRPVLDRLNELEQEQREMEERLAEKAAAKGKGKGGGRKKERR